MKVYVVRVDDYSAHEGDSGIESIHLSEEEAQKHANDMNA